MEHSAPTILLVDDDPDDCVLVQDAWSENRLTSRLRVVNDGEQLMDYLRRRGRGGDLAGERLPALILLDLNMPKKDGREALREIKTDPDLRGIPIVVLTTSNAEEDIARSYDLGVNSFIIKPSSFGTLVDVVGTLSRYWFGVVALPPSKDGSSV
jgi:CheY-like chemotaxis protein